MEKFKFFVFQTCYKATIAVECETEEEALEGALKLAGLGKIRFAHQPTPLIIAIRAEGVKQVALSQGSSKDN